MQRYHLRNDTHFVEFSATPEGYKQAKAFRKLHSAFARRRIRDKLQMYPSQIELGKVYEIRGL